MIYYKAYSDAAFVGVGTTKDLRKHQKKHNLLLFAKPEEAQYLCIGDGLYRDKWMKPVTSEEFSYQDVTIVGISKEEYDTLKTAIANEEEILVVEEEQFTIGSETEDIPVFEEIEITVEYVRNVKIRELKLACSKAISDGFDVEIDGETAHFSMTANDQLNLQDAVLRLYSGATSVPYHPDGGEFVVYDAEDMHNIVNAASDHKTYHLAYFNSLKKWVNALKRISSIQAVEYGSDIPAKYQSAFLKSISEG